MTILQLPWSRGIEKLTGIQELFWAYGTDERAGGNKGLAPARVFLVFSGFLCPFLLR